ncbi:hypothetical protein [Thermoactinomyces sp. CICC 10522]|uniref:hypothetical protein n=1 Tax=Thermoactinomyces sp. CICC 10522 TaxID=2767427 RepID=UPI0018DC0B14|nr:hypothetical protein [Thermoactinomyces sp. CICC 10522]MBH8605613.1 hypothetical protein [Thermoactinomyces sp. CICC 10522]
MTWYQKKRQKAMERYHRGYYPRHRRTPNLLVCGLYELGYLIADFGPMCVNLFDAIYTNIRKLFAFIVGLLIELSTVIILIGTIAFSIFHSIELLRRAGATGGLEYIGVVMFEVVFISSTATLTGTLMKKKKPSGFFAIVGLMFSIAGFIMGIAFVEWSNITGMADSWTGRIIGGATPVLLIITEGVLAFRYLNEFAEEDETKVLEIIQRNRLTIEDVRRAIQLYLNQTKTHPPMVQDGQEKVVKSMVKNSVPNEVENGSEMVDKVVANVVENVPEKVVENMVENEPEKVVINDREILVENAVEKESEIAVENQPKNEGENDQNTNQELSKNAPQNKPEIQPENESQAEAIEPEKSTDLTEQTTEENNQNSGENAVSKVVENTVPEMVENVVEKVVENAVENNHEINHETNQENDHQNDQETNHDSYHENDHKTNHDITHESNQNIDQEDDQKPDRESDQKETKKTVASSTKKKTKKLVRSRKKDPARERAIKKAKKWALEYYQENGDLPGRTKVEKGAKCKQSVARDALDELREELGLKAS